jgi:hypothetical protein
LDFMRDAVIIPIVNHRPRFASSPPLDTVTCP